MALCQNCKKHGNKYKTRFSFMKVLVSPLYSGVQNPAV